MIHQWSMGKISKQQLCPNLQQTLRLTKVFNNWQKQIKTWLKTLNNKTRQKKYKDQ